MGRRQGLVGPTASLSPAVSIQVAKPARWDTVGGVARRKRDEPHPLAETIEEQDLIVFLTERAQSAEPLTAEEFARALCDEEFAKRIAALKRRDRKR